MSDNKEYNGWSNYATWRIHLEMFDGQTDCRGQYDAYKPLPDQAINGKLTMGENIADLGGLLGGALATFLLLWWAGAWVDTTFHHRLGPDTLLLGWGQDDDNTHSPNEKFCLADFHRGIKASAQLWEELSKVASKK